MGTEETVYIYGLIDPHTNQLRYVGKTNKLRKRLREHRHEQLPTHKSRWIQSLKRESLDPVVDVLETCDSESWEEAERFWINYLRFIGCPLTNLAEGGHALKMTQEIKDKISKANKGKIPPPHVRAACIRANKTRIRTPEELEKKRQWMLIHNPTRGKHPSEETRNKMRLAKIGKPGTRTGSHLTEEQKQHLRECAIKQWQDPEMRKRCIPSPERMREMHLAQIGSHRSDESKERMRQSALRRFQNPIERERMGKLRLGCKVSDETKRKMSISHMNRHLMRMEGGQYAS